MKHSHRMPSPRRRAAGRREKRAITAICIFLALVILGLASYAAGWYANRARIQDSAERYRAMYNPRQPDATAEEPTAVPAAAAPTVEPTPVPVTATPTAAPTAAPATATPTAKPTEKPSPTPKEAALPVTMPPADEPAESTMPAVVDELIPTPNPDTLVFALPTAPPVQASFGELLAHNPDTVGYLEIEGMLSLPVVQRENDNDYYLGHTFDGDAATEGSLFLDGTNRLVPEDDCLIVYGHNMRNGAMFGSLDDFESLKYLKAHAIVRFDTLYENRQYVPFAAFTASMESDDSHYFDVRQFIFDETGFELFTLKMQSRSVHDIPIDVRYGDHILLLVTCDYTNRQGRFILGLRQLRPDESAQDVALRVAQAKVK